MISQQAATGQSNTRRHPYLSRFTLDRMSKASPTLASIAAIAGRLTLFVFLILGIPIIIFLPSAGFDIPSVPPLLDQITATIFYGLLAAFGGVCGVLITWALGNAAYRWLRNAPRDTSADTGKRLSPLTLFWYCWGAALSWAMFIGFGRELIDVWLRAV